MAGRKPGGPKTGGRRQGSVNRATADVKAAAQAYTQEAIDTLADIMRNGESEAARVAASNSILDRGHGKAKQAVELDATLRASITAIERRVVDPPNPDS